MTQVPGARRSDGVAPSCRPASTESDERADRAPTTAGGCVEAGAIDRIRASETDRDALAEYLLAREWKTDPALSPRVRAMTAHSQHTYDGWCALCRADLPAIVDAIIAAGWRPTTEGDGR